ncbi:hypothetical protein [Actinomadura fibrosa]|uniref:Uncharacterized protein n=1 Tax=Actinomadura fibrosa TaxID=111802 RepID=A0ABW2XTT4_9ACTN|nr:hypothetical protein [Actinomadura fibrosa]
MREQRRPTIEQILDTLNEGVPWLGIPMDLDYHRDYVTRSDPDPYYLDTETIVTVRFSDGRVRDFTTTDYRIDEVMTAGADLVTALQGAPHTTLPRVEHVRGGALIDVAARTVTAWPLPHPGTAVVEGWGGWEVIWSDLGLKGQVAATGRDPAVVAQTPSHLVREAAYLISASDRVQDIQQYLREQVAEVRESGAEILKEAPYAPASPEADGGRAALLARLVELRGE